jgi:hypothetical protein
MTQTKKSSLMRGQAMDRIESKNALVVNWAAAADLPNWEPRRVNVGF